MKTLYIIRGLPGSGKSTLAHQLTPWVCEADTFFTKPSGQYEFDASRLRDAHQYCQNLCRAYMMAPEGIDKIAVSNTGSQRWEFAPYIALAQQFGYNVCEITLTGNTFGSIHNVPDDAMARMKERWER